MGINDHTHKYPPAASMGYSFAELGLRVHLLVLRAERLVEKEKRETDLRDAHVCLELMESKLSAETLRITGE